MEDKWRQDIGEADTPPKGKQDLGKADTPANTGRQGDTRPRDF